MQASTTIAELTGTDLIRVASIPAGHVYVRHLSSPDGAAYSGQGGMGKATPVKFTFSPGKDKKGEESDKLFDVTLDFGGATSTENCKK